MENPINALRAFFAQGSREVTLAEFTQFWKALSNEEKDSFRSAMGCWDGKSEFVPQAIIAPLALPASSAVVAMA
jgi:hypothetical protein